MQRTELFGTTFFSKSSIGDQLSPQEACFRRADAENHWFFVQLQRYGSYKYGSYPNLDAFLMAYENLPEEERFGFYELIRTNARRCHYFDIEWLEPGFIPKEQADVFPELVHETFARFLGENGYTVIERPYIKVGSRSMSTGQYKCSYHLVYSDIILNNASEQKALMMRFRNSIVDDDRFYYLQGDDVRCRIDFGVYTANRVMRMPWSRKHPSDESPMKTVTIAPLRNFFISEPDDMVDSLEGIDPHCPRSKKRRVGLPIRESEGTPLILTNEKQSVIRDVFRKTWNVPDVRFKRVIFDSHEGVFILRVEFDGKCPIHEREHTRLESMVRFYPGKGIVKFHCMTSDEPGPSTYLAVHTNLPILGEQEPVVFDQVYEEPAMRPYVFRMERSTIMSMLAGSVKPYDTRTLLIQGQMGIGKTKALYAFLADLPKSATVMFVTYRISLADKYHSDLSHMGFVHYNSVQSRNTKYGFRVVTCFDSLYRFSEGTYDYLIIDEIDSVLMHTGSRFVLQRDKVMSDFKSLLRSARYFIGLDAFISPLVFQSIAAVRGMPYCIENTFRRPCDRNAYFVDGDFTHAIIERLRNNEPVAVCSMTKAYIKDLDGLISTTFEGQKRVAVIHSDDSKLVGGDGDDQQISRGDVDAWRQADALLYSPSISAGVSFEHEHFKTLFVYAYVSNFTPLVTDLLQMMNRIRSFERVYIYFKRRDLSSTTPEALEKLPQTLEDIVARFNEHDARFIIKLMGGLEPPINSFFQEYRLSDWSTLIYCHIVLRRLQSNAYFEDQLRTKLGEGGYTISNMVNASAAYAAELQATADAQAAERAKRKATEDERRRAIVEAVRAEIDMPEDTVQRIIDHPSRLSMLHLFTELVESPDVEARLSAHVDNVGVSIDEYADTVGGKHVRMDARQPRMAWAIRFLLSQFGQVHMDGTRNFDPECIETGSVPLSGRARAKLYADIREFLVSNPLPRSGTMEVTRTGEDTVKAAVKILQEVGFDAHTTHPTERARRMVVGFGDWKAMRPLLDDTAKYEKVFYHVREEDILKRAKSKIPPEELRQMSQCDLAHWFVHNCRRDKGGCRHVA